MEIYQGGYLSGVTVCVGGSPLYLIGRFFHREDIGDEQKGVGDGL